MFTKMTVKHQSSSSSAEIELAGFNLGTKGIIGSTHSPQKYTIVVVFGLFGGLVEGGGRLKLLKKVRCVSAGSPPPKQKTQQQQQ